MSDHDIERDEEPPIEVDERDSESPEVRARRFGWRPRDEFTGPADKWVDAEEFLARQQDPRVLYANMRTMEGRFQRMERELREATQRLQEAQNVMGVMVERIRSADERAMANARRELEEARRAAIESADVARAEAAQRALDEMAEAARANAASQATAQAPANGQATQMHPDVADFIGRNPWYSADAGLATIANGLHVRLQRTHPHLSLADNLRMVEREIRSRYLGEGGDGTSSSRPQRVDTGGTAAIPARTTNRNSRSFDTLPREAKEQYHRWSRMMPPGSPPLTKEEWAATYWEQEV